MVAGTQAVVCYVVLDFGTTCRVTLLLASWYLHSRGLFFFILLKQKPANAMSSTGNGRDKKF